MIPNGERSAYTVQLEIFEGPLDLLLHLIKSQEIDIYDIPISRITDQYLQYLEMMQELNITVAGEFVVMAATLIYIKSQMLLPQPPPGPDGEPEDPRRELVERLLEHERFKKAADLLHDREVIESSVWPRGAYEFEEEEKEAVSVNVFDLIRAFHQILERYKENIVLEVEREAVSLEEKLKELRQLLLAHQKLKFSMFLQRKISRLHLIVIFFALLELVRLGEVRVRQAGLFEDIEIVKC